jgi:hypothetical protein
MNKESKSYFVRSALKEISLLRKYFHITGVGDNVKVTDEITPEDVLNFFREYYATVRPPKLSRRVKITSAL